jgi:glutamate-ammonia-ligase adenylyltransferase
MQDFDRLIEPDLFHWQQLQTQLSAMTINDPQFIGDLQRLALGSNYAVAQLSRYPELIGNLVQLNTFNLEPEVLTSALDEIEDEAEIKRQLRRFRHRKLTQIIFLDICRDAPVRQTLAYLSQLADLLIDQALTKAETLLARKHGQPLDESGEPMRLNVIGMGKLGGGELNFSSDIDLICSYSGDGQLKGFGQQTYNQFFTHVAKLFKALLHETTADGFVYRVDLRLRPWGEAGPLVLSHSSFEHYYQLHGREWEQYAMVKARVITGSDADRQHLKSILQPFVYRRYHDYRVFDGLAQMKRMIDQQARKKHRRLNLKTGPGGIREIEFFVQAFQILKGGRNHQLQTNSLYQAIQILSEQQISDQPTLDLMLDAYNFLRQLENRIQMLNDQQTHEIPEKPNYLERLALLGSYDDWPHLEDQLSRHLSAVSTVFDSLFSTDDTTSAQTTSGIGLDELDDEDHLVRIQQLQFINPQAIDSRLREFYRSKALIYMSDRAKKRFRGFFPELLKLVAASPQQQEILDKMLLLLSSIAGRSIYLELLHQNIPLLTRLVDLFAKSNWIASEVTQHPMLIESVLYPHPAGLHFDPDQLARELRIQLDNVRGDEEMELDVLRQFKRQQTIEIATAELTGHISTDRVSLHLSQLAEVLLAAIHTLSRSQINQLHGEPRCIVDGNEFTPGMGIIAYGKLGGNELHYQSDLDIIFLHNSNGQQQETRGVNGQRIIDNATYFSRLAQKIISRITLLTAAGKLYEIDTRLRPDGASGMMVSSLNGYRQYQLEKAWVWEHQAIIRARFVTGNPDVAEQFGRIRLEVLELERDTTDLALEIVTMREKMYLAKSPPQGDLVDIKQSRGCMVDIEFMVQYLVLINANKFASLLQTTDNTGLINELYRLGLVSDSFQQLATIYLTFHDWLHRCVLQNQSAEIPYHLVEAEIGTVKACWQQIFGNSDLSGE